MCKSRIALIACVHSLHACMHALREWVGPPDSRQLTASALPRASPPKSSRARVRVRARGEPPLLRRQRSRPATSSSLCVSVSSPPEETNPGSVHVQSSGGKKISTDARPTLLLRAAPGVKNLQETRGRSETHKRAGTPTARRQLAPPTPVRARPRGGACDVSTQGTFRPGGRAHARP